uniref:Phosphoribulokinase/uridine kinase domain-containing protein n=1 Tax=Clastoptera arizonana TaxID=38151 RepID=A0A1B6DB34_9HEMI
MKENWTVIAVSGVTCGGKSSLVKAMKDKFPHAIVIHQDDYFFLESDPRHTKVVSLNCLNWEIMSSIDMDKLRKDVEDILKRSCNSKMLILDGFLVLNDEYLSKICKKKLYFILSEEECRKRRVARVYIPPDVPGYFDKIVWPEFLKSKDEALKLNPDLQLIDGSRSTESILTELLQTLD